MKSEERGARSEQGARSEEDGKLNPQSSLPDPAATQRVRWRCRRGLLELDIMLGRFVEAHYAQLDEDEQRVFDALLDMPDNPLWDMIAGRQEAAIAEQQALLEKIRAA